MSSEDDGLASLAEALCRFLDDPMPGEGTLLQQEDYKRRRAKLLNKHLFPRGFKLKSVNPSPVQESLDYKLYLYPETERPAVPRYVNIGAGGWSHPYWHNLDMSSEHYGHKQTAEFIEINLLEDRPLPLESGTLAAAYTSHVVEHLPDYADQRMFDEVYRALEPGGYFRITCPDHEMLLNAYRQGDVQYLAELQPHLRGRPAENHLVGYMATAIAWKYSAEEIREIFDTKPMEEAFEFFTSQIDPAGNAAHPGWHMNWMSPAKLERMLRKAGFTEIYESRPLQSRCPAMRHPRLFDLHGHGVSLFVEARK